MDGKTATELLPCPFCGGEVRMHYVDFPDGDAEYVFDCACGRKIFETASKLKAVTAWNTRATHDTLTAEQVRHASHGHYKLRMVLDVDGLDVPQVMFDWQAIADELNAELGSGTCEMEYGGDITPNTAKVMGVYFCSECGSPTYNDCMPYYCMYCGKAVER